MYFCGTFVFAFVALVCLFLLAIRYPSVLPDFVDLWRKTIGWVLLLTGVAVFAFGFQGFMEKQGSHSGAVPIAIYETLQLYFLNASDDAARIGEDSKQSSPNSRTNEKPAIDSTDTGNDNAQPERSTQLNWWLVLAELLAVIFVVLLAVEAIGRLTFHSFSVMRRVLTVDHIVVCGYGRIGRAITNSYITMFDTSKSSESSRQRYHGRKIAKLFRDKRRTVIVVDNSMSRSDLEWAKNHDVIIVEGDARDPEVLGDARVPWASEVFVATGDDEANLEVMAQLRFLDKRTSALEFILNSLDRNRDKPTAAYIHLTEQDTIELARRRLSSGNASNDKKAIQFEAFSSVDHSARRLLEQVVTLPEVRRLNVVNTEKPTLEATHTCSATRSDVDSSKYSICQPLVLSEDSPPSAFHLVLIGFDDVGQGLALRMAELCQFADGCPLTITIFDSDLEERTKSFLTKHPSVVDTNVSNSFEGYKKRSLWSTDRFGIVNRACSASFQDINGVHDPRLLRLLRIIRNRFSAVAVVVCGDDGKSNFISAEQLMMRLRQEAISCPVFTWLGASRGFPRLTEGGFSNVIPFGLCMDALSYDEITDGWVEQLAKWLHYSYEQSQAGVNASLRWQAVQSLFKSIERDGPGVIILEDELKAYAGIQEELDSSWNNLAKDPATCEDFRHSNLSAATHAIVKLGTIGLKVIGYQHFIRNPRVTYDVMRRLQSLKNSETPRKMEHNRWLAERLLRGWTFAETKDPVTKKRPGMKAWEPLESFEKKKDKDSVDMLVDLCMAGLLIVEEIDRNPITNSPAKV